MQTFSAYRQKKQSKLVSSTKSYSSLQLKTYKTEIPKFLRNSNEKYEKTIKKYKYNIITIQNFKKNLKPTRFQTSEKSQANGQLIDTGCCKDPVMKEFKRFQKQQFFKIMCKISFSHIIDESSLRKGLFQLIDDEEFSQTHIQERSTDNSEENSEESLEDAKAKKNFEIQGQILDWFKDKHVFSGNPEDLIYKSVQRQKAIILPKKSEVNGLYGNKIKMNNLLARRAAKLIEVNVSG